MLEHRHWLPWRTVFLLQGDTALDPSVSILQTGEFTSQQGDPETAAALLTLRQPAIGSLETVKLKRHIITLATRDGHDQGKHEHTKLKVREKNHFTVDIDIHNQGTSDEMPAVVKVFSLVCVDLCCKYFLSGFKRDLLFINRIYYIFSREIPGFIL